jgi:hypothetical protein
LAVLAGKAGKLEECHRFLQTSLEIYLQLGNMGRVLDTRKALGDVSARLGWLDQARAYYTANKLFLEEVGAHAVSLEYDRRLEQLNEAAG